jgi:hypothetical protein
MIPTRNWKNFCKMLWYNFSIDVLNMEPWGRCKKKNEKNEIWFLIVYKKRCQLDMAESVKISINFNKESLIWINVDLTENRRITFVAIKSKK